MHPRYRGLAVAVSLPLVLGLAACTHDQKSFGVSGIGIDSAGRPVGVVEVCKGHMDGAWLMVRSKDPSQGHRGEWAAKPSVSPGFTSWSLADGAGPWTITHALAPLEPGVGYTFFAWAGDDNSQADAVDFSAKDLASLRPGQVLWLTGVTAKGADINSVASETDFQARACTAPKSP